MKASLNIRYSQSEHGARLCQEYPICRVVRDLPDRPRVGEDPEREAKVRRLPMNLTGQLHSNVFVSHVCVYVCFLRVALSGRFKEELGGVRDPMFEQGREAMILRVSGKQNSEIALVGDLHRRHLLFSCKSHGQVETQLRRVNEMLECFCFRQLFLLKHPLDTPRHACIAPEAVQWSKPTIWTTMLHAGSYFACPSCSSQSPSRLAARVQHSPVCRFATSQLVRWSCLDCRRESALTLPARAGPRLIHPAHLVLSDKQSVLPTWGCDISTLLRVMIRLP